MSQIPEDPRRWCGDRSTRGVNSHVDQEEAKQSLRPAALHGLRP